MSSSLPINKFLHRVNEGETISHACEREGLDWQQNVEIDAHFDGKPVCRVIIPWVVSGHAIVFVDENIPNSVTYQRLSSLTSALSIPVFMIRRSAK